LNFRKVAEIYNPWLHTTGLRTLREFPSLHPGNDLDDVVNEGLHAISRNARRFVFFCGSCGDVFLYSADLRAHALLKHSVRGPAELVSIGTFCECGARMTMRRAARNVLTPEIPEAEVELGGDDWSEDLALLNLLVKRAEARLSEGARAVLLRVLCEGCADVHPDHRWRSVRAGVEEVASALSSFGLLRDVR